MSSCPPSWGEDFVCNGRKPISPPRVLPRLEPLESFPLVGQWNGGGRIFNKYNYDYNTSCNIFYVISCNIKYQPHKDFASSTTVDRSSINELPNQDDDVGDYDDDDDDDNDDSL